MKQCYKIRNLFGSYLYNTITPEERIEVENHLQTCQKCSEDLKTRRIALDKVGVYMVDSKDIDQERFMWNVYRKIAEDAIRQKKRQVTIRKFVLQPAIATLAIALIVTFGVAKFRLNNIPESPIPTASIQNQGETKKATEQIVKAKPMITEKIRRRSTVVSKSETKKQKPAIIQPKPDVLTAKSELSNSRDWLMDADFTYFSLGDSRRALSKYDMIINRYPNTEAAIEAQKRINAIISSEYSTENENSSNIELIKTGI